MEEPLEHALDFDILPQPNDTTCGPTCLHAVYRYYSDNQPLGDVIAQIPELDRGGTLAVNLACHALQRGYAATIYTFNLHVFDPTWFRPGVDISERLRRQRRFKRSKRLRQETDGYLEFLARGGQVRFQELTSDLLRRYLLRGQPILTGLSATYLYQGMREYNDDWDDIRGEPTGHFVVLGGYDRRRREVLVWDPLQDNPPFKRHRYTVSMRRLLGAILLGGLTHDANLVLLSPSVTR